jgi:copper chaperone CopZ
MRTILLICLGMLFTQLQAQTVKTETFIVKGNCGDCKERIENAADIRGVKISKWNEDSKVATITYDSTKVNLVKIKEAIASAGYEPEGMTANPKAYKKLPACCKYNDGKATCNDKKQ